MSSFQIEGSASELQRAAQKRTGIFDVTDVDIQEPLERLLASLNSEAQLNESGAQAMEQRLVSILSNRLRFFRDLEWHPEILEQQIVRPVFLTGGGRTGSTKLHLLLAASGDFKYIPFWQVRTLALHTGKRDEDPAERIREAQEFIHWFDRHAPRARMIHAYETFEPEEETHIYEHSAFGVFMNAFVFVPSFVQWYVTQDFRKDLDFFKRTVQYLQWQFHAGDPRPWIFKYPAYQGSESLLRESFPDAVLVTTHRDPVSSVPSAASLFSAYYQAYSDVSRDLVLGPMMLEGLSMGITNFMAGRRTRADLNLLDVGYTELTKSSPAVTESVYRHARMTLNEPARHAMRTWEQRNVQHKHGLHRYTLEQFSLSRAVIEQKFQTYIERYRQWF